MRVACEACHEQEIAISYCIFYIIIISLCLNNLLQYEIQGKVSGFSPDNQTGSPNKIIGGQEMIFYIVYTLAVVVLILHFTGWLLRRNMEWAVMVAAVALFAVNILDYLKII